MKQIVLSTFILLFLAGCNNDSNLDNNQTVIENNIFYIDYYKESKSVILLSELKLGYIFNGKDSKAKRESEYYLTPLNINYQWGYIYKVKGFFIEGLEDSIQFDLDEIISKEKNFKPFTLTLQTYTDSHYFQNENNVTIEKEGESLIKRVSDNSYLAYNELEFKVYYEDLIDSLNEALKNDSITLTFNFEDNGTIFLERIEE